MQFLIYNNRVHRLKKHNRVPHETVMYAYDEDDEELRAVLSLYQ